MTASTNPSLAKTAIMYLRVSTADQVLAVTGDAHDGVVGIADGGGMSEALPAMAGRALVCSVTGWWSW